MAFKFNAFVGMCAVGENMLFGYSTNDLKNIIEGAGYFNGIAGYIRNGDIVMVSGDLDGTPFHSSYTLTVADGVVSLTEHASVVQNAKQVVTVRVGALGTPSTHYIASPIAGAITKVIGVSNAAGAGATATVTVNVDAADIASLPFLAGYTAGTKVEDATVTANTLSEGEIIAVSTDGGGDGTGEVIVTLEITPA